MSAEPINLSNGHARHSLSLPPAGGKIMLSDNEDDNDDVLNDDRMSDDENDAGEWFLFIVSVLLYFILLCIDTPFVFVH